MPAVGTGEAERPGILHIQRRQSLMMGPAPNFRYARELSPGCHRVMATVDFLPTAKAGDSDQREGRSVRYFFAGSRFTDHPTARSAQADTACPAA
ncbi:hypothetical protein GCM10022402_38560 [Salinactinospora qingdaonensis]|uniref:Uncharacterized protein n=1 Tax=Salinactinospora qingdaonensis TaxID=702744 RepID=A0ABP7G4T6_9ACTN